MLSLPTELALQIIALLDVESIFVLRKTCTSFRDLTYERVLWLGLYHWVRSFLPITSLNAVSGHVRGYAPCLDGVTQCELERIVVNSLQVERSWLLPRHRIISQLFSPSSDRVELSLSSLEFVQDWYLLAIYEQGLVNLWCMDEHWKDMKLYAWYEFPEDLGMLSSAHEVSADGKVLYVAITLAEIFLTRIVSIHLEHESADTIQPFDVVNEVNLSSPRVVRAIDVESGSALFSHVSSMDVVNWRTNASVPITAHADDDLEELWNGITSMTFCGPYIVCFRARSIELYPIPTLPGTPPSRYAHYAHLPVLIHRFSHITFRRVSVSQPRPSALPSSLSSSSLPASYTISFVGYDVFHGLFQCLLTLSLTPVPSLAFDLAALHPVGIARDMVHAYASVFGAGAGKPAFVGAWALGPAGRRGVWVERMRESLTTSLYAFSWDQTRPNMKPKLQQRVVMGENLEDVDGPVDAAVEGIVVETEEAESSDEEEIGFVRLQTGVPLMDGKIVMEVPSIDLREDITICALSEATGRIALGLRAGSIKIL